MILTLFKWVVPAILIVIGAAAVFTKKTFNVEAVILASPEAIWSVLMDTDAYADWNPVFVGVDGAYAEGEKVTNAVRFPDSSDVEMGVTIKALSEARELRQYGGTPGLMTFDHQWILEPIDGGTRVIQHEVDRGLVLWFWNSDWIEPAYQGVLDALAQRVAEIQDN